MEYKPYYQDENFTIYHGDALDIMPWLRDHGPKIDAILTDPDYNGKDIGTHSRKYPGGMPHLPEADYQRWCRLWFGLAEGLTDRISFSSGTLNMWNYRKPKWVMAWYKPGATGHNKTGGFSIWEPILVYGRKVPRISQDAYDSTPLNFINEEWSKHPCPKSPGVWRWVLSQVARPGEMILDPFMGSGTTLRVAKDLEMKAIGIEKEREYCDMAIARLRQEVLTLA